MRIVIDLPFPVSTNALWRVGKGRVFRSKRYVEWIRQADALWMTQKHKVREPILGKFTATIALAPPDKRKRDLDNVGTKAVLDFLQRVRIIENDSNAVDIRVSWLPPSKVPSCQVTIEAL